MFKKKHYLYLDESEYNVLVRSLVELKNRLLRATRLHLIHGCQFAGIHCEMYYSREAIRKEKHLSKCAKAKITIRSHIC